MLHERETNYYQLFSDYYMNIQIFGRSKCFDTKKAERWFKERKIAFQYIDVAAKPLSSGEWTSVKTAVGVPALVNYDAKGAELLRYLASEAAVEQKVFENQPAYLNTPVVRNGRKSTVGFKPDVWQTWD
jgi:arsenate reductase-like glutaredoxin family protein